MLVEKAVKNFKRIGFKRLNCAQALIDSFKEKFNLDEELILEFKSYGGGRAPEGFCGAYYAGRVIIEKHFEGLKKEEMLKNFEEFFLSETTYATCKEIKTKSKTPCTECVKIAAEFINKINI